MNRIEALSAVLTVAVLNTITLIGGAILLSLQFGWKVGVGVAFLTYFLKNTER